MNAIFYSHRWCFGIVLIVLLNECLEVSGTGRECPQGQVQHWSVAFSGSQYVTCCFPTRCGVGQHVKPCEVNGTNDICQMCSAYHNQSLRTSSYTMEPCTYWPLDKDCNSLNNSNFQRNTNDENTRRCMCNIEIGKKFVRPESEYPGAPMESYCQRRSIPCQPGHEPIVNGDCKPCKDKYFKSEIGFKLCEPKTNCIMLGLKYVNYSDATADNNCSEPDPITTPKQYVPDTNIPETVSQKSSSVLSSQSTTASSTTQDTARFGPSQDLGQDDDRFPWPVLGVVLFLVVLVVFIVLVMFWRNRKGMSIWVCASSKNCSDPEKNYIQGSSSLQTAHHGKHNMGDGHIIPQHLTPDGDKIINNNINSGLSCDMGYSPNGHANGNIHHAFYNHTEHTNGDTRYYMDPRDYRLVPTTRQGILRNGNHNVVYGQSQGNVRDRSIDSIGQEKLQVHVDDFEANQDLCESAPLLVADPPQGVAASCHVQPQVASGSTPPALQANVNPLHLLAFNRPGRTNFGPNFVHSGVPSPPVQPQGPVVTYAPATGVVTFTRSTSVIASPEGEVDEDEIEARLPRLSQLLTDGESSSVMEANPAVQDFFRCDSPGRETTQQLRTPSERLRKDPHHTPRNGNATNQQSRRQGNVPTQQRPGFPPVPVGPVPQRDPQLSQPDHRIMNLKEQQLEDSLSSSFNEPVRDGQQKVDPPQSTLKTVAFHPEEGQQTQLKTRIRQTTDFSTAASANEKATKIEQASPQTTESKQIENGRSSQTVVDRRRQVSGVQNTLERKNAPGGANFQNVSDRKRVPSGGSNSSGQNTLERQRAPSGDQQRPCIKNSSPEEADTFVKTPNDRYNRTVSFEEEDTPQLSNKQRGPSTEAKSKSNNSPEKVDPDPKIRGPLRSVSDPEQKMSAQTDSDEEETERKCVSLEYNVSNGSSKVSVNSDHSGTDSSSSSPCRTALYRRSQSENAQSSSDSSHKPPPRSMSEEKPQKMDRPIAKVKPMPASDNAVNQLPFDASDDTGTTPQLLVAAAGANNSAPAIHEHSSDEESDREETFDRNVTTMSALEEDEMIRETGESADEDSV